MLPMEYQKSISGMRIPRVAGCDASVIIADFLAPCDVSAADTRTRKNPADLAGFLFAVLGLVRVALVPVFLLRQLLERVLGRR